MQISSLHCPLNQVPLKVGGILGLQEMLLGICKFLFLHVAYSSLSMACFSPFSSLSSSRLLWCHPRGVKKSSLDFSSTLLLNNDSARDKQTLSQLNGCAFLKGYFEKEIIY